jgi:hypothetical protein
MERVERTTRIADATYTPRGLKAARGSESEDEDEENQESQEDDGEAIASVKNPTESPVRKINFVA